MPSTIFARTRWTIGIALPLAVGAMLRYPGGTPLDPTTTGYSLLANFLSDLGMTVAYDGQPNRLGAGLFVASLLVLVAGLGASLAAIIRLHAAEPSSRRWTRLAAVSGLLACVAFAGVAVTPENRVMAVHLSFTVFGWRIMTLVAGCMALASLQSTMLRRRVAAVWLFLTGFLAAYAAMLAWGPIVLSASGLVAQVVAQKCAAIVVLSALGYIASEADRAQRGRVVT